LNKTRIFLIFLLSSAVSFAQPVYTLTDSAQITIQHYALLPDHGEQPGKIVSDTTLPFIVNDSLRPSQATSYWLRMNIVNPFREAIPCIVQLRPGFNNALYYFDANAGQWIAHQGGILPEANNGRLNRDGMSCILRAQTTNTIYVHVDIKRPGQWGHGFKPVILLKKEVDVSKQEQIIWITWVTSLTVLLLFLLNNVYIYFSFKDQTILYYLVAQLGGMIYITAYKQVFSVLFPCPVFSTGMLSNGSLAYYDLNDLLIHGGILVILYGIVQFCRSYLSTRQSLPRLDAFLKYGLNTYLFLGTLFILINTGLLYVEPYAWLIDNIFAGLLLAATIYAGIAGYRRKLPAARPFLLANIVSFTFMLAVALYHLLEDMNDKGYPLVKSLLPDLAIITFTFGFSVALVARTRSIQQALIAKEREALELEADLREMEHRQVQIERENQQIGTEILQEKTRNEQLKERLEANQRELASSTLYIAQKNELLARLKIQIKDLNKLYPNQKHQGLQDIESSLQNNQYLHADWTKFKIHFEQVHPQFFENLQASHPSLTNNEIRLYAYFYIKLSTKEIAALLNIDPASVRRAKTRLYKKMKLGGADRSADLEG
jgi:DNA-binding CsgD family transcriptional regulator